MRVTYQCNRKTYRLYPLQVLQVAVIPLIFDRHNHPSRYNRPPPTQNLKRYSLKYSSTLVIGRLPTKGSFDKRRLGRTLAKTFFASSTDSHDTLQPRIDNSKKRERRKVVHLKIILRKKYAY